MANRIKKLTPIGNNLYEDERKRLIIGDAKNRRGYLVSNSEKKKYELYQYRLIAPILIFSLFGFYIDWKIAIVLLIVSAVAFNIAYKKLFLENLIVIEDLDIPERATVRHRLLEKDTKSNILRLAGTMVLPVLLTINVIDQVEEFNVTYLTQNYNDGLLLVVSVIISIYSIYMAIITLGVIIEQKKN